jgi:hypothetical protein
MTTVMQTEVDETRHAGPRAAVSLRTVSAAGTDIDTPAEEPTTAEEPTAPRATSGEDGPSAESAEDGQPVPGDERERARAAWQESADAGSPLTGRELGEQFGRSERWGRDRVAEVRRDGGPTNGRARSARPRRGTARNGRHAGNGGTARSDNNAAAVVPSGPARHVVTQDHGSGALDAAADGPGGTQDAATPLPSVLPVPGVPGLPPGARLVAWAGFLFGTVISVAANVMYAWLPTLAGKAGAPGLAPQVGAAVWPIALVISVEVLSRVPWQPGWTWQVARYGGAGVVALGAAVISYGHLRGVLAAWNYGTTGAAVGPLVIDGLMTISGFALLAMSDHGKHGKESDR